MQIGEMVYVGNIQVSSPSCKFSLSLELSKEAEIQMTVGGRPKHLVI